MFQHLAQLIIRVEHVSSTVTARMLKDVACEHCGMKYHYAYRAARKEHGQSLYGMYSERVVRETRSSALKRASARVRIGVAPVACPKCGKLQSDMVVELRRRVMARAAPAGIVLPLFFLAMAASVLLLTTNFLKEPVTTGWLIGVIVIGAGAIALGIRIGLAAHSESRSITANYFGRQQVPTGAPGSAGPSITSAVTHERIVNKSLF